MKRWYDGYQLGKYHVYNPNAVVNLMTDGNFQSYWSGTASYDSIVPLINMDFDGLKTAIIEMLSGAAVEVDVASFQNDIANIVNKDDVLTYLIHMGYLGYSGASRMAFVPNEGDQAGADSCDAEKTMERDVTFPAGIRIVIRCNVRYGW